MISSDEMLILDIMNYSKNGFRKNNNIKIKAVRGVVYPTHFSLNAHVKLSAKLMLFIADNYMYINSILNFVFKC